MIRLLALAFVACTACIRLDPFLFAPTAADPNADLLAGTQIPVHLRQEVWLTAADGTQLDAYVLSHDANDGTPPERHGKGILYCHGNADNISVFGDRMQNLWQLGYNVLIFDYRGFGKNGGKPSEPGVYMDARAARAHFEGRTDLGLDANQVALYGYSLGGAVCTQLAIEAPTRALIIESTFASVNELVTDNEDLNVPLNWYADASMLTRTKITQHHGALLVMHGEADTYIQVRYGHEIANAAMAAGNAHPIVTRWVPGATHGSVPCAVHYDHDGECGSQFDPEYLDSVSSIIDGAIP